jgi:alpha-L-rhamnosidase
MLKWLEYVWSISDGPLVFPSKEFNGEGFSFGDWLQPVGDNRKPRPTIGDDCAATLYHFISNDLAANIGRIIGEEYEAQACAARAAEIKKAFIHEYFTGSGRLAHNDQTSYALAFLYDLVPDEYYEQAKANFRRVVEDANYLIGTGFIGTPALLPALTKLGMNDVAEKVFLNREVPGWLYQVAQGATTIWERWDAIGPDGTIYDPLMNSYNHYAYGAVCQWLFEAVGGVAPSETSPGFDEVSINPHILPAIGSASMWHECRHGRIEAGWTLDDDTVTYRLTLPVGCIGRLTANPARKNVRIDGAAIDVPESGMTLGSGQHEVTFNLVS